MSTNKVITNKKNLINAFVLKLTDFKPQLPMNPTASHPNFLAARNMQETQGIARTSGQIDDSVENKSWQINFYKCFETFLKMQQQKNQDDNNSLVVNKNTHQQGRLYKNFLNIKK